MWEIMQRGADFVLWMRKNAEGKLEWSATQSNEEPTQSGLATAKLAIERLREDMKVRSTDNEPAGGR